MPTQCHVQSALLAAALDAESIHEFRHRLFRVLDRAIGHDLAAVLSIGADRVMVATADGWAHGDLCVDGALRYSREQAPLAVLDHAVRLPHDLPSVAHWRASAFYREKFAPYRATSCCGLAWTTRYSFGCITLARTGRAIRRKHALALEAWLPAISAGEALFYAARNVSAGTVWHGAHGYNLAPREREIAALTVRGLTNREIAALLGVSWLTVRNQLTKIFRKCDVTTRAELAYQMSAPPPLDATSSIRGISRWFEYAVGTESECDAAANDGSARRRPAPRHMQSTATVAISRS